MTDRDHDLGELLHRDVDEYDVIAATADQRQRNELLTTSMPRLLVEEDVVSRFKVLQLTRALLAASAQGDLTPEVVRLGASVLAEAAAADDDPHDRLAALRTLAVMISRLRTVSSPLASSFRTVFERARHDSSEEIREFADEVMAPGGLMTVRRLTETAEETLTSHVRTR